MEEDAWERRHVDRWRMDDIEEDERERLIRILRRWAYWLGIALLAVGLILLQVHALWDRFRGNDPARLDIPCVIHGQTQLYVTEKRIYLFCEPENAVNVYDMEGNFLFRAQGPGPRYRYGTGSMAMWGDNIYLTTRNERLFRFDRNGNPRGRAQGGWVYDREGEKTDLQYSGTVLYFDERHVCYRALTGLDSIRAYFYRTTAGTYQHSFATDGEAIRAWGGSYVKPGESVTYQGVVYGVSFHQLYKIEEGRTQILAETSLMEWYLQSTELELVSVVVGGLLCWCAVWSPKRKRGETKERAEQDK